MGAYLLLAAILVIATGLGATLYTSYAHESHERRSGPAVISLSAWLSVTVAMAIGIITFIILRNSGVVTQ